MKKTVVDSLIIGFAPVFHVFWGGECDLSPYLGLESGPQWGAGFVSYFIADIGLGAAVDVCHHPSRQPGGHHLPHWEGALYVADVCRGPVHWPHAGHSSDRGDHL